MKPYGIRHDLTAYPARVARSIAECRNSGIAATSLGNRLLNASHMVLLFNLVTPRHRLREPHEQRRALPECRLGRRRGRQVHGLGVGPMGATCCRGREGTDRWF